MQSSVQRKLAAILMADVKGYSRLMSDDEEETLRRLREYQKVINALLRHYEGCLVDAPGDSFLAVFTSVVDAVWCARAVQNVLSGRNAGLPDERRMELRIGIHIAEVILDGSSIYGDGVNIAARLQRLAEPGGICVSSAVYERVKHQVDITFVDMGAQRFKNIAQPTPVYRALMEKSS